MLVAKRKIPSHSFLFVLVYFSLFFVLFCFDMGGRKKFSTISTTPDARHSQERAFAAAEGVSGVACPRDEAQ